MANHTTKYKDEERDWHAFMVRIPLPMRDDLRVMCKELAETQASVVRQAVRNAVAAWKASK